MKGTRLKRPDVAGKRAGYQPGGTGGKKSGGTGRKLDEMVRSFATAGSAANRLFLEYFGEPDAPTCGNCDVCSNDFGGELRVAAGDAEALLVRKALSGVARMSQKTKDGWQGRFGRGRVCKC